MLKFYSGGDHETPAKHFEVEHIDSNVSPKPVVSSEAIAGSKQLIAEIIEKLHETSTSTTPVVDIAAEAPALSLDEALPLSVAKDYEEIKAYFANLKV